MPFWFSDGACLRRWGNGYPDEITSIVKREELPGNTEILTLDAAHYLTRYTDYTRSEEIDPAIEALSEDQLIKMNIGAFNPKSGTASIIGNAGFTVAGAAGQSCLEVADIPSMVMADGPAELRLSRRYAIDAKGVVHSLEASMPASLLDFMPKPILWLMNLMTYRPKKQDQIGNQYATAIPIGTAVAQSFNLELAEEFGKIVGFEMERFSVHL